MKEHSGTMAGVCMLMASPPSPGLAATAASGPMRDGQRDQKKTETIGNNDRVAIACNSIYTITHGIRSLNRKTADCPLMSGWASFQILASSPYVFYLCFFF